MIAFTEFYGQLDNPHLDKKLLEKAYNFGRTKHEGQVRKISGLPYFTHPINVALLLREFPEDVIIAALLHDTIEDTDTSEDEISDSFNPVVANLVWGMTKEKTSRDIFGPLKQAAEKDNRIILVKLADRLDNLSDGIYEMPRKTQKKYLEKTPEILELSSSYGIVKFHEEINERLERLEEYYNQNT